MPTWVLWLIFGIAAAALAWYFFGSKMKLPSGTAVPTGFTEEPVNSSGNQYGNLT